MPLRSVRQKGQVIRMRGESVHYSETRRNENLPDDSVSLRWCVRNISPDKHLDSVAALEAQSYPEAEAADFEQLSFRAYNANEFFLVAEENSPPNIANTVGTCSYNDTGADDGGDGGRNVVGFVCGTLVHGKALTEESMSSHAPNGDTLCMHSVVVKPEWRHHGLGTLLVQRFVDAARCDGRPRRIKLICKEHLVPLYKHAASFLSLGTSDVVHGGATWTEMELPLTADDD